MLTTSKYVLRAHSRSYPPADSAAISDGFGAAGSAAGLLLLAGVGAAAAGAAQQQQPIQRCPVEMRSSDARRDWLTCKQRRGGC